MQPYREEFYKKRQGGARQSAEEIIPELLKLIRPRQVIDVGCALGTWLSVFKEYGVEDIWGVDGDYVDKTMLEIPKERFLSFDLTKPLRLDRQFDLVMSLEVAEHLPPECAEIFVDSLTGLGPVILFSAAIPFQGGKNHINEQWPEYWAKLFQGRGYVVIDALRKKIWQNDKIEWFYAQNILFFVRRDQLENYSLLKQEFEQTRPSQLSIVHPRKYLEEIGDLRRLLLTVQEIAALIPPQENFILVDQEVLRHELAMGHRILPFLERGGEYWGPPPDDETAIQELKRLRLSGASFIVFGWPAFWWLDYYPEFHRYLRAESHCLLSNDRLVIFGLRSEGHHQ